MSIHFNQWDRPQISKNTLDMQRSDRTPDPVQVISSVANAARKCLNSKNSSEEKSPFKAGISPFPINPKINSLFLENTERQNASETTAYGDFKDEELILSEGGISFSPSAFLNTKGDEDEVKEIEFDERFSACKYLRRASDFLSLCTIYSVTNADRLKIVLFFLNRMKEIKQIYSKMNLEDFDWIDLETAKFLPENLTIEPLGSNEILLKSENTMSSSLPNIFASISSFKNEQHLNNVSSEQQDRAILINAALITISIFPKLSIDFPFLFDRVKVIGLKRKMQLNEAIEILEEVLASFLDAESNNKTRNVLKMEIF